MYQLTFCNILGMINLCGIGTIQYIPRNMHTVFALLCFVVVIHWLIFPYPSGLLHWHCGNLTIAPVPVKQPWWIWINTSYEFIMNDCITTTKQSTTKQCAYFLGYTVWVAQILHEQPVTKPELPLLSILFNITSRPYESGFQFLFSINHYFMSSSYDHICFHSSLEINNAYGQILISTWWVDIE